MRAIAAFHLWPRLHREILEFLARVPDGALGARPAGSDMEVGAIFRHIAAVEDYWRLVILDGQSPYREIPHEACPDPASLAATLTTVFTATERLLDDADLESLATRPVTTGFPVSNAMEALSLCHLHTIHHRSEIVSALRSLGVDPRDWV